MRSSARGLLLRSCPASWRPAPLLQPSREAATPAWPRSRAGYRRWQALMAERDRLKVLRDELDARAEAAIAPLLPPEPPIPAELEPYSHWNEAMCQMVVWWGTVPRKGKVRKIADAHMHAESAWRRAHNRLLDEQPDAGPAGVIEAERSALYDEANEVRSKVLELPARSPAALLIKVAIAIEATSFDDIDERFAKPT
jgi:hypothetical protein